jgi:hypothetical protein
MYIGDVVDRLLSSDKLLENLGLGARSLGLGARSNGHAWGSLGSFGAGLVVGSVLGLLFAPKPGSELRREVRQRAHDLRDNARGGEHSHSHDPATPPS